MNRYLVFLLAIFFLACNRSGNDAENSAADKEKKTSHAYVGKLYPVPDELEEISAISFINDSLLTAVQDEEGIIFIYSLNQEKVVSQFEFTKGADFEGLAIVDKDLWVVSSKGNLYQIVNFMSEQRQTIQHKTALKEQHNIEGLTYDADENRLLLGAKDKGFRRDVDDKDIYAFDLASKQLDTVAVYSIKLKDIESFYRGDKLEEASKKFLKRLGNKNLNDVFRTSALAIHPQTKEIYVLSSLNNFIAVLNRQGQLVNMIELEGKEHHQPEGLSFTSDGRLFVSNEARKNKPNIIELTYEKK